MTYAFEFKQWFQEVLTKRKMWWGIAATQACERLKQEGYLEFKTSRSYIVRSYLKAENKTKNKWKKPYHQQGALDSRCRAMISSSDINWSITDDFTDYSAEMRASAIADKAQPSGLQFFQQMLSLLKFQDPNIIPFTNKTVNVPFKSNRRGEMPTSKHQRNEISVCSELKSVGDLISLTSSPPRWWPLTVCDEHWINRKSSSGAIQLQCRVHHTPCQAVLTNVLTPSNLLSI